MRHWTEEMFVENPEVFAATMRRRIDRTGEEVEQLLDLLGAHGIDPKDALDVACGIGRHAVELAEAGVEVDGIDISPEYVVSARDRADEAGVGDRASFEVADMRRLCDRDGTYDLVTNMWTAFGYFDEETNETVASGFRERVAEDDALVMELVNREGMLADYRPSSAEEDDGLLYVEQREYRPETGRMETELTLFEAGDGGTDTGVGGGDGTEVPGDDEPAYEHLGELSWDLRVYGPAELRRLLERAGFSQVHLYAGLDAATLERDSTRLAVVAEP